MTVFEKIKALLDENGVEYEAAHHAPTLTSQAASEIRGTPLEQGAKSLVMRGNSTKNHFLFVIPANFRIDGKKVKQVIGERVSFAKDPEEVTGCVPGSVPPYGSVIGLKTYCDKRLSEHEVIDFNAGSLTDSIDMKYEDYLAVEKPEIVDVVDA